MGTKTITITEEAYEKLVAHKGPKDSFSDVISEHFKKSSLFDIVGILSEKEGKELKRHIAEGRKEMRKRWDRTARKIR